jgi:hypothetical protein
MIYESPEAFSRDWPIRETWAKWCKARFGKEPDGSESLDEGKLWAWQYIDAAFRRIAASYEKHGYKPSLISDAEKFRVVIEADGTMPVVQGNKRVGLLREFDGPGMKVQVNVHERHPDWVKLKQGIFDIAGKMDMYHPIPHPDFAGWAVTQPCTERLAMMKAHAPIVAGTTMLDLGCHSGWMCREFAKHGVWATGVENDKRAIAMAWAIGDFQNANGAAGMGDTEFNHGQIEKFCEADDFTYDTCLLLSVAMHLFGKLGHEKTWALMDDISQRCDKMYFDIAFGGYQKHLPFTEATMIESIIKNTHYTKGTLLGRTKRENRPFVVFEKG